MNKLIFERQLGIDKTKKNPGIFFGFVNTVEPIISESSCVSKTIIISY